MNNKMSAKDFNSLLTVSPSPHIKHSDTTTSIMLTVILALVPALIWSVVVFGFRSLTITLVSVFSCVLMEYLYQLIMKKPVTVLDFSAAVTGVLLAFNLPVTVPLWIVPIGAFFAIVIVKQLFGGIGKNIVNPALAARVFMFSWTNHMSTFSKPGATTSAFKIMLPASEIDAIASATPLASLKEGILPDVSLLDMFIGYRAGCIGEISVLLILAGGLALLIKRVITWHIPVAYIGTVFVVSLLAAPAGLKPIDFALYQILSGGLFIGAFFMATDYATSPVTRSGRIIFGVGCGLITVFIRFFGGYSEGVSFSILIMNLLVWYIDRLTKPVKFGGRSNAGK